MYISSNESSLLVHLFILSHSMRFPKFTIPLRARHKLLTLSSASALAFVISLKANREAPGLICDSHGSLPRNLKPIFVSRHPFSEFHEDYEVVEKLGEGGFARIYTVRHKETGTIRVAKIVRLFSPSDWHIFKNEVEVMSQLDSPYVGRVVSYYLDAEKPPLTGRTVPTGVLITHFLPGVDLLDRINERIQNKKYFSDDETWSLANGMLNSVASVHQAGFLHRDIKPENFICVERGYRTLLKLIDFGLASAQGKASKYEAAGTSYYMSPETVGDSSGSAYSTKSDCWSVGVILAILASRGSALLGRATSLRKTGHYTIPPETIHKEIEKIRDSGTKSEIVALITSLMQEKPRDRLSAVEALSGFSRTYPGSVPEDQVHKLLDTIEAYLRTPLFARFVRAFVVHLTEEERLLDHEIVFRNLDRNADGLLTHADFGGELRDRAKEAFTTLATRDPCLTYSEFQSAMLDLDSEYSVSLLKHVFGLLCDQNRTISRTSLDRALGTSGEGLSEILLNSCAFASPTGPDLNLESFMRCMSTWT
jgi:serine/threonine protein kinase